MFKRYRTTHVLTTLVLIAILSVLSIQPTLAQSPIPQGHLWRIVYEPAVQNSPWVEIVIVEEDPTTGDLNEIGPKTTTLPCTPTASGQSCNIALGLLIEGAYNDAGHPTQTIPWATEMYKELWIEVTGQWNAFSLPTPTLVFDTPFLKYGLQTAVPNQVTFSSQWEVIKPGMIQTTVHTQSNPFPANTTDSFAMRTVLKQDTPSSSLFNHLVSNGGAPWLNSQDPMNKTAGLFDMTLIQFHITEPADFNLERIVIDPPGFGQGR